MKTRYVVGSKEYYRDIIEYFKKKGAIITDYNTCDNPNYAYYIDNDKNIDKINIAESDYFSKIEGDFEVYQSGEWLREEHEYKDCFNEILEEMKEVHRKKNADYGNNFHKRYERWGFLTALLRLSDKMERLENIYEKGEIEVKDESVEDTLLDLANYAVMTIVELKNNKASLK